MGERMAKSLFGESRVILWLAQTLVIALIHNDFSVRKDR